MEEDIKILEDLKNKWELNAFGDMVNVLSLNEIQAIEHLVKGYNELEERQKSYNTAYNQGKAFENHKWISLIKETINKLKEDRKKYYGKEYPKELSKAQFIKSMKMYGAICYLQELLEKR